MNQPFGIETTTIGMMLWNPTSEDFDMQYAGISITLKAGEKQLFALKCASHLLNGYGQRGLTSLQFGDEDNAERIGKAAIQRNRDFKEKQVVEYNQRNEARKAMNLGYLPPTEMLKKYAIELGLKLLEPYAVRDEERAGISEAKRENEALKEEMADLKDMLKRLLEAQKKDNPDPEPEKEKSDLRVRKDGKWVKE
jgi:6-phosphofructokinase